MLYMLFERHTKNRKRSLKQHIKYFNFRSKIQLDHPVQHGDGSRVYDGARGGGRRHDDDGGGAPNAASGMGFLNILNLLHTKFR